MSVRRISTRRQTAKANGVRTARADDKLCRRSRSECQKLRREIAELRSENRALRQAILASTNEPVEFDRQSLLSQVGKRASLQEFIAKLERGGK